MDIYAMHALPCSVAPDNPPVLTDQLPVQKSAKQSWLEMALMIEERQ